LKELAIRTITGISLIILFAGSLLLGPIAFLTVVVLIYIQGLRELGGAMAGMHEPGGQKTVIRTHWLAVHAFSGAMILLLTMLGLQYQVSPAWFILPLLTWSTACLASDKLFGILSLFWLTVPLAAFLGLGWMDSGGSYHPFLPLAVIALVWINDTLAFLAGRLLGRHRMTPVLSPGKTWEGFFGGLLFTLFGGWLTFHFFGRYSAAEWLILAVIISIFGFLGDLFESKLKRTMGVKNTGNLLPGHGGILDRFDSLLFVAPVVLFLIILLNILR